MLGPGTRPWPGDWETLRGHWDRQ